MQIIVFTIGVMVTGGQVQIILLQQCQMPDLFLLKEVELRVKEETKKGVINQLNQEA